MSNDLGDMFEKHYQKNKLSNALRESFEQSQVEDLICFIHDALDVIHNEHHYQRTWSKETGAKYVEHDIDFGKIRKLLDPSGNRLSTLDEPHLASEDVPF